MKIRESNSEDIDNIYNLQIECFSKSDLWYRAIIQQYLDTGFVIENNNNKLIGVLLHGDINACDRGEEFIPLNDEGKDFLNNNLQNEKFNGIVMICIHPEYQNQGLATILVKKYFDMNKQSKYCLFTRKSNYKAIKLYNKMGYSQIGFIPNKYFFPNEDALFFMKND